VTFKAYTFVWLGTDFDLGYVLHVNKILNAH